MTQMDLVNKALKAGNVPAMTGQMIQYFANTSGWETEEDWFAPRVFTRASEFLEAAKGGQPFFLTVDGYDPHEPWDPPEEYINLYDEGYERSEEHTSELQSRQYLVCRLLLEKKNT